jgi:hypothetical protein
VELIIKPSYCNIVESAGKADTFYVARDTGFLYLWEGAEYYHVAKELLFVVSLPPTKDAIPDYLYIETPHNALYRFDGAANQYIPLTYQPDNVTITSDSLRILKALQLAERVSGSGLTSLLDTGNGLRLSAKLPNQFQESFVQPQPDETTSLRLGVRNTDTDIGTYLTVYKNVIGSLAKLYYQRGVNSQTPPIEGDELVTLRDLSQAGTFIDAPIDDNAYGRKNAAWVHVSETYTHIGQTPLIDWLLGVVEGRIDDSPSGKIFEFYTQYPPSKDTVYSPDPALTYPAYASVKFRFADSTPARPHRYVIGYNVTSQDFAFATWDVWWNQNDPNNPWVYTLVQKIWDRNLGWLLPSIQIPDNVTLIEIIDPDILVEYWAITGNVLGVAETETVETLYKRYVELRQALVGANTNLAILRDIICKTLGITAPCTPAYGCGDTWGTIRGDIGKQGDLQAALQKKVDRLPYWTPYQFAEDVVPGRLKFSGTPINTNTSIAFRDGTYLQSRETGSGVEVRYGVGGIWRVLYSVGEWLQPVTISGAVLEVTNAPDFDIWQESNNAIIGLVHTQEEADTIREKRPDALLWYATKAGYSTFPSPPEDDGEYVLKASVVEGVLRYDWVQGDSSLGGDIIWEDATG